VHVGDRFAFDEPSHSVDQTLGVDRLGVEQPVGEHDVLVARRDIAALGVIAGLFAARGCRLRTSGAPGSPGAYRGACR
jgi:hypothetical protein